MPVENTGEGLRFVYGNDNVIVPEYVDFAGPSRNVRIVHRLPAGVLGKCGEEVCIEEVDFVGWHFVVVEKVADRC